MREKIELFGEQNSGRGEPWRNVSTFSCGNGTFFSISIFLYLKWRYLISSGAGNGKADAGNGDYRGSVGMWVGEMCIKCGKGKGGRGS